MLRLIIATLTLASTVALAHGPAEWIQRGGYRNAVGELCCGERDCGAKVGGSIVAVAGGWQVDLPYGQALPSPDGQFWRCQWNGERKCFFAPPPSM